jgi:hypothetical protein
MPASSWHLVIVCGARDWHSVPAVRKVLAHLQGIHGSKLLVITGGAPGADTICLELCYELGIHVAPIAAHWDVYGAAAGPIRNRAMLACGPDEVIAFHEDLAKSKGTASMLEIARKARVRRRRLWAGDPSKRTAEEATEAAPPAAPTG